MMFRASLIAMASVMLFAANTAALAQEEDEDEAPERNLTLDKATVMRLGIRTAPLQTAQYRNETSGFGVVLAFDTLAQTDADLTTAESAAANSRAAADRARALFAADVAVSRQTVEAAERQAAADAAQLALAERKAVAAWGQGAPWRTPQARSQFLARLASGDLALARVTFAASAIGDGAPSSIRAQRVDAPSGGQSWTSATLWSAPTDPTFPGRSFFALIERARGLAPGERLLISLPARRAEQGVIIPAAAVVIAEGKAWYYAAAVVPLIIPLAPYIEFTRQMLDLGQPLADGYFVTGGEPGEDVVVDGAGLLLARETGTAEEE